jgi:hypothetical protein
MKLPIFFLLALLVGLAGCESVRQDVRERFSGRQVQTKLVNVDKRKAYEAAVKALQKMNYTIERGGPAQGFIHAIGPMDTSVTGPGTARQVWFDAKFEPSLDVEGATNVEVSFAMLIEEDFNKRPGQGPLTPMRDSPLYEVFFSYLDQCLAAK